MIKATVVIPHREQPASLTRCVAALARQQDAFAFDVVVVDDGSRSDATRARLDSLNEPWLHVLRLDHGGPAHARNSGAAATPAELLLFTDADCIPGPGWVAGFVRHFADEPTCAAATGPVVDVTKPRGSNRLHRFFHAISGPDALPQRFTYAGREILGMIGANLAIRRAAFEAVGGFDSRFPDPGGEDYDLAFRLQASGFRADFVATTTVAHAYPTSVPRLVRRWVAYGAGKQRFADLHSVDPAALHLLQTDSPLAILRSPQSLRRVACHHFAPHLGHGARMPLSGYIAEACFQWGAAQVRSSRERAR